MGRIVLISFGSFQVNFVLELKFRVGLGQGFGLSSIFGSGWGKDLGHQAFSGRVIALAQSFGFPRVKA